MTKYLTKKARELQTKLMKHVKKGKMEIHILDKTENRNAFRTWNTNVCARKCISADWCLLACMHGAEVIKKFLPKFTFAL
jgi:hypothetical protein